MAQRTNEKARPKVTDEEFVNAIRNLACIACGHLPPNECHHILSRGAGGKEDYWNLLPLCSGCHTQDAYSWHRGKLRFLERFPHVWEHLQKLGWERNGDKIIHPGMKWDKAQTQDAP